MAESRPHSWNQTLSDVEQAIQSCLTSLSRYEAAFASVLMEPKPGPGEAVTLNPVAAPISETMPGYAEALRSAAEAEHLLEEQELLWQRWQEVYNTWKRSIEHPVFSSRE